MNLYIRPGNPDFLDLPWDHPFEEWGLFTSRLEDLPHGLSRHLVWFVNYDGCLYAFKALPVGAAAHEYEMLRQIEELRLPAITPVGQARVRTAAGESGVLITRYLERSMPYRSLFMRSTLARYQIHLLDAVAGLLVQLHLVGIYWGDCSLSNALFRQDAGALQAYLVDAENAEVHTGQLNPTLRHHDLEIMEENISGELVDLAMQGLLLAEVQPRDTGRYIRQSYQNLWEEITREEILQPDERYRIQERVNAMNQLGFSVGEIALVSDETGEHMRLRVMVTDRNFHRDQLYTLTGLEAEETQALKMMNEILELKATLAQRHNRSTSLSSAANTWLEQLYQPTIRQLEALGEGSLSPAELYCQVLEHKWYLSERARHDVGHRAATEDYLQQFGKG